MKKTTIFLLLLSSHVGLVAQSEILEKNNVSALINPKGEFFQDQLGNVSHYQVPKSSGLSTLYNMRIWMSAKDQSNRKYYIGSNYKAGPISTSNSYAGTAYTDLYGSSVWQVAQDDIDYHVSNYNSNGYSMPASIAQWPGNGATNLGVSSVLAPFVDVNENGIYDPANGDYPEIRGDGVVYTIIRSDELLEGQPFKMELHLMFYQYHTNNYLDDATFLYVQAFNRSNVDFQDVKQALYCDFDIGFYGDDYIGCDSSSHLLYGYNSDDFDESYAGSPNYGELPPAQGVSCLSQPATSMGYYSFHANAPADQGLYHYYLMRAHYNDTLPWESSPGVPNAYMFNGIPYDTIGVSEGQLGNVPGDRRGILTIDFGNVPAHASVCSDYMLMYARNGITCWNQVNKLVGISNAMIASYEAQVENPCSSANHLGIEMGELKNVKVYPNPSKGVFDIDLAAIGEAEIKVLDLNGKVIFEEQTLGQNLVQINVVSSPGIYLLQIDSKMGTTVSKIVFE